MSIQDVIRLKQQQDRNFEPSHNLSWGVIVEVDGSTSPPNRPNMTWVDMFNKSNGRIAVLNDSTLYANGTPVRLSPADKPPFVKITGTYENSLNPVTTQELTNYNAPAHAINHQYPSESNIGLDVIKVYQPALQPLKTTGNGIDLTVTTQALLWLLDGSRREFLGKETDLTSYVPIVSGETRRVLIYLDKNTGLLEVSSGTAVLGVIPIPYPTAPTNSIPSAYVKLTYGQSTVVTVTHIEDARGFITGDGATQPYKATQNGQIVIALDGSFQVAKPILDSRGNVITDNGEIVTI